MQNIIKTEIQKLQTLLQVVQEDQLLLATIEQVANVCVNVLQQAKKILFAGNGGSAADAQHLAAELTGRLRYDRPALAAIALTTDTSALTAIANDYSFEYIFARQVEALGMSGDVFFGISTSGNSPNILKAFKVAREKNMITVGLTGAYKPHFNELCDYVLNIPGQEVSKIQECHIMLGHIVCLLIEENIQQHKEFAKRQAAISY